MIQINEGLINEAGKQILKAWVLHQRGDDKTAARIVQAVRDVLEGEAIWVAPGQDTVQKFLNEVILLDTGNIPLDSRTAKLGAEMVYFQGESKAKFRQVQTTILQGLLERVA